MPSVEALRDLLAKVETATDQSRDLDEAIMATLYVRGERHIGEQANDGPRGEFVPCKTPVWINPDTDRWVTTNTFEFTGYPELAERLLDFLPGGWCLSIRTPDPTVAGHSARAWAKIEPYAANAEGWEIGPRDCTAATRPLAILQATVMALLSAALLDEAKGGGRA